MQSGVGQVRQEPPRRGDTHVQGDGGGRQKTVSKEQMKTKLGRSRNEREGQGQRKPPMPPFALYQVHCRRVANCKDSSHLHCT